MRVAVVIPVYNQAQYLCNAIDSALAQNIQEPYRVIVVNDGSKDDALEAARSYGDRIDILNQENQGLSMARNNGFMYAIEEYGVKYLLPLDSDDMIRPFMLRECVEALDANLDSGIAYTNIEEFGQSSTRWKQGRGTFEDLQVQNFMVCCSLIRTKAFLQIRALNNYGYDPVISRLGGWEDWLFYMMVMALGWQVVHVDSYGFLYRKHGFSMVSEAGQKARVLRGRQEEVMKQYFGIELPPMKSYFDLNRGIQ